MANEAVLALNKQAEEKRNNAQASIRFRKLGSGETWEATKVAESTISQGKYGMQAVYLLDDGKGLFKWSVNVGNPVVAGLEKKKIGEKLKISRAGTGIETRYTLS